ncbi:DUF1080 domain-containing protein [Luteolibacter ambystomatis]|uniref:DUF1080 domain-containing protein n=1 Tax=Luteolibacter ambystomatis TaxID=2824561 RepID=A0A975G8B3_9BACT|nr:DUF1080 domain-containing protein [Luteolibacter ambystomatis]QUE50662.1 DUF1080 domain-containing protein [Luteolibacter ambystomatis]
MKQLLMLLALVAPAFAQDAKPEFKSRPLFNGKDLTGWHGEGYVVEDGAIACTPQGRNLVTDDTFADYILDFEFKLTPGANNGIGIHYPGTGDSAYVGMEVQVLDSTDPKYKDLKPYQFHGSLYTLVPAKQGLLKPVGEWNKERIVVDGPNVRVEVNGEVALRANLDELNKQFPKHEGAKRRGGHLAFLGHGDRVLFRNLNITELPPGANSAGAAGAGFTRIFDGKTLTGWKTEKDGDESWVPINGILKHIGTAKNPSQLWTEKEYGDFTMVFDWRWNGTGPKMQRPIILPDGTEKKGADGKSETVEVQELDSGVYVRGNSKSQVNLWNWPVGSGEVYGYRTDGSQSAEVRAGVTPKEKADHVLGEWNRTLITVKGDRLTVIVNDKKVIDKAQLPGMPAKGKIALQHHGASIDFANIWIRDL